MFLHSLCCSITHHVASATHHCILIRKANHDSVIVRTVLTSQTPSRGFRYPPRVHGPHLKNHPGFFQLAQASSSQRHGQASAHLLTFITFIHQPFYDLPLVSAPSASPPPPNSYSSLKTHCKCLLHAEGFLDSYRQS